MSRTFTLVLLLALVAALAPAGFVPGAGPEAAEAQTVYRYAVKYVCGFNKDRVGLSHAGVSEGEPSVKYGNYATEINIVNVQNVTTNIKKFLIVLNEGGHPIGREPKREPVSATDNIALPPFEATMDDCNRLAELRFGGSPLPTPLPLLIGYFILESTEPIEVTAVYTAEVCTNFDATGPAQWCEPGTQGAGLSIDVEQIEEVVIP